MRNRKHGTSFDGAATVLDVPLASQKSSPALPEAEIDQLPRSAIEQTRLFRLRYRNKDRIVEPHDYGEQKAIVRLLAFQVGRL